MSKRPEEDFLKDILEGARRILFYTKNMEYEVFLEDLKTQDAVVRNIEIIGEATKNLSEEFRKKHTEVPWKSISGMRDKLIHDYFGVNVDIVWGVVREDLPKLVDQINQILLTLSKDEDWRVNWLTNQWTGALTQRVLLWFKNIADTKSLFQFNVERPGYFIVGFVKDKTIDKVIRNQ